MKLMLLNDEECRTIEASRAAGQVRIDEGQAQILVFLPISCWMPGTDYVEAGYRFGAMLEERFGTIDWDEPEMAVGVWSAADGD